jgi:hypothetical protein
MDRQVFGDLGRTTATAGHQDGLGAVAQSSIIGGSEHLRELLDLARIQLQGRSHASIYPICG